MMPILVPLLRKEKELAVTDAQAALLMRMSASTIDRKLKGARSTMLPHGRTHTQILASAWTLPTPSPGWNIHERSLMWLHPTS